MPTVNETIKALQDIVALNPKFGELPCVYSHDDEGNEYQGVINVPCLCQIYTHDENNKLDLDKGYRFLEVVGFYANGQNDIALEDCNCVIIN